MIGGGPWDTLGIEPTEDTRAIRRAYAQRLKTIDVEADPQAFVALREAFEAATAEAEWRASESFEPGEAVEYSPLPEPAAPPPEQPAPPLPEPTAEAPKTRAGPWRMPTPEDIDGHIQALIDLLNQLGEERRLADKPEVGAMLRHWNAIVADPRMQQVAFYGDSEAWLGNLIAQTIPFSNPLVEPAVTHFRWLESEGKIDQSPAAAFLVDRLRVTSYAAELDQPRHKYHRAWQMLTTADEEYTWNGGVSAKKVRALLAVIRRDCPSLEGHLDPHRVARWDAPIEGEEGALARFTPFIWPILVVLFIGFSIFGKSPDADRTRPEAPRPTLVSPSADLPAIPMFQGVADAPLDIQYALAQVGDGKLLWPEVQRRNNRLALVLKANWEEARNVGENRYAFANRIRGVLFDRVQVGIRNADHALISAYRRIELDKAKALLKLEPALCDRFVRSGAAAHDNIPAAIAERENALESRILLLTNGDPPAKAAPTTFWFSGEIAEDAARRARLTRARFDAGLDRKGSARENCVARIGLIEAALAAPPKAGLKLLRGM